MVRKLIISITFLMSGISLFAQGNFMFNQHSTQDCQYGNLAEYATQIKVVVNYQSTACEISPIYVVSLATARQALDSLRSCTLTAGWSSVFGFVKSLQINSKVLGYEFISGNKTPICTLFTPDEWGFVGEFDFPVGATPIVHIENGIITYIEYY